MLAYTEDIKLCSNKNLFSKLIKKFNKLIENGITINADGVIHTVYFEIVLIIGDNLGLNSIVGFVESFKETHCCRICTASYDEMQSMTEESVGLLRNRSKYDKAINEIDFSNTGIKEPCEFNKIINFHVADNFSLDIMHDAFEGVCKYVMQGLIEKLIIKYKLFTLEYLNRQIKNFKFPSDVESNRPPPLKWNLI